MGYSCAQNASKAMELLTQKCYAQTGSQNTYNDGGESYFWEICRKEHDDGAVTGTIHKNLPGGLCRKVGTFKVEPDGTMTRGPKVLKEWAKEYIAQVIQVYDEAGDVY